MEETLYHLPHLKPQLAGLDHPLGDGQNMG